MDGIVSHSPNDAIAYPSHVRAIGAVIAPRRYRNMAPKPRTRSVASQCVSIMPDGTRKVFTPVTKQATNIAGIKRTVSRSSSRKNDIMLMATMGTIHEVTK